MRKLTSPPASIAIGTPSRYSTRLPMSEGRRAPGVSMPTRFSGSAPRDRHVVALDGLAACLAQQRDGLRRCVLLATEACDEAPAADLPARLQAPAAHQQVTPRRQPLRLARQQPPEHHAPAPQQRAHHVLDGLLGQLRASASAPAGGARDARPAPRRIHAEQRDAPPAPRRPWRLAPVRGHQQRAQAGEAVGVDEPERDQFARAPLRPARAGARCRHRSHRRTRRRGWPDTRPPRCAPADRFTASSVPVRLDHSAHVAPRAAARSAWCAPGRRRVPGPRAAAPAASTRSGPPGTARPATPVRTR